MINKIYIIIIFLFVSTQGIGQNYLKLGNKLFKQERYCEAKDYYNKYLNKYVDENIFLKRGICNYYCKNLDKAIEDLENSKFMGSYDDRINYYLAKTYHDKQDFEKAIVYYKKYLADIGSNQIKRNKIINQIKRCANAIDLKYNATDHFIENWGPEINTKYNDIIPLQSPGINNLFYFSSNRIYGSNKKKHYKEFQVEYSNGRWERLYDIYSSNINKNTIFLDFLDSTQKVIFFQGYDTNKGSLLVSKYSNSGKQLDVTYKSDSPILAEYGFRYLQYVNDSTIVFSSNREGGFGGYDLYLTGKREGKWFEPINLGSQINSKYDEISPFITKDGTQIYFSSNNLKSIGGFDIFKSNFSYSDDDWSQPKNLGLPINSSGNETGFRMLSSGKGGIYNSDRKDMGFGEQDIYWIYFKNKIDINKNYSVEIPYLRNRHLKLINNIVFEENQTEIVLEKDKNKKENPVTVAIEENNKNDNKTKIDIKDINEQKPEIEKEAKDKVVIKKEIKTDLKHKEKTSDKKEIIVANNDKKSEDKKKETSEIKETKTGAKQNKDITKKTNKAPINNTKTTVAKKDNSQDKKFIIPLLLIKNNDFRDNQTTIDFIDNLARLLKKYPEVKVEFVGNSFSWTPDKSDILNSIRITERLADSLKLRMIEPERIKLRGVGSNFPAAKPHGPIRSKNIITKVNNRIDVYLHNTDKLPVKVKKESFYISRSIEDPRHKLYETVIEGLSYKIQVKEGDFLFANELLNKYQDSSIEKDIINNKFIHTIGLYKEYISANELYKKLIKEGNLQLEIVPYINGLRINKKEALSYAKKYLDLVNYLEDNR